MINARSPTLVVACLLAAAGAILVPAIGELVNDTPQTDVQGDYFKPGVSAAEVLRARGYKAMEYYFFTEDGYKIQITRGTNPLFNQGKRGLKGTLPILFFHGTVIEAALFLTPSPGVQPKNFRKRIHLDANTDPQKLYERLKDEPSTRCLAFLAMNFGYEIWLVNRRGFGMSKGRLGHQNRTFLEAILSIPESFLSNGFYPLGGLQPGRQGKKLKLDKKLGAVRSVEPPSARGSAADPPTSPLWHFWRDLFSVGVSLQNLPGALNDFGQFRQRFIETFDPGYWDFSLDEPTEYEVPQAMEFVLKHSGKPKLHTVGLSSGGAVILLAAASQPARLTPKIASAVLWAPSLNMGTAKDTVYQVATALLPVLQPYDGPFLFSFMVEQVIGILQSLCSTDFLQRNLCSRLLDLVFGFSGHQAPVRQSSLACVFATTSHHELAQLGQFAHTDRPCYFNYNDPAKNLQAYSQLDPPCYDLSRVKLSYISMYAGNTDILVSADAINITRTQLGVPSKHTLIDEPGINFNHGGSILNDHNGRLVVVPSLIDIERAQAGITTLSLPRDAQVTTEKPGFFK